jgi:hypothetical protein
MPDLKNLDVDRYIAILETKAQEATREIVRTTDRCRDDIREVARSLEQLPNDTVKMLLQNAPAVLAKEFECRSQQFEGAPHPQIDEVSIGWRDSHNDRVVFLRTGYQHDGPTLKPGKYRAYLFIVPVAETP